MSGHPQEYGLTEAIGPPNESQFRRAAWAKYNRAVKALAALALVGLASLARPVYLLDQVGRLTLLNEATGVQTLLDDFNRTSVRGFAYNPVDDQFYFVDANQLFSFPLGGQPAFRRNLAFATLPMGDIAIDRSGVVYGVESGLTRNIWRFGVVSGETLIGSPGTNTNFNVDFGSDGSLYAWGNISGPEEGLYVISRRTAKATLIALGDSPRGRIFAVDHSSPYEGFLVDFNGTGMNATDLATGALFPVGTTTPAFPIGAAYRTDRFIVPRVTLGTVNFGRVERNNLGCLEDRDGDALRVCKFVVPNQSVPPIRFELLVDGATGQSTFASYFKGRMTTAGAFNYTVEAKNIATGAFETVFIRLLGSSFLTEVDGFGSTSRYFSTVNGDATLRINIRPTGPVGATSYCLELDQFAVVTK